MKIYHNISEYNSEKPIVLTSGTFDGVHLGHQSILNRVNEIAQKNNAESVLLTFFPHPRWVLFPDSEKIKLINTLDEKTRLIERSGIQHLIIHPFTKEFSRTSSLEFVRDIVVNHLHTIKLVIGYDHRFGRNREGSFEHLKEFGPLYGFEVEEIEAQEIDDINISSTKIRNAITSGDIVSANSFLGYDFMLTGEVVKGDQLGRTLGYPTANIYIKEDYKILPSNGVYAVRVKIDGTFFGGMMNIGKRPTVNGKHESIEVHIFDFNEDIYNKKIEIQLIEKIRDEKKFNDTEELKAQLEKDKFYALNIV